MQPPQRINQAFEMVRRSRIIFVVVAVIFGIFTLRLFDLEVIRYGHYKAAALSDQLEQLQIPAQRGLIEVKEGNSIVPIVLNQQLFTLYADPTEVKNVPHVAQVLSSVIGGSVSNFEQLLKTPHTRYVVLGRKLTQSQNKTILNYQFAGIGSQGQDYRSYPDGSLASQTLGFVNNKGVGEYGIEQAMNKQLSGKPGLLKAITDINGVPLPAAGNNISVPPVPGDNVVLTLNMGMQAQMEKILAAEYKSTKSEGGVSAIIMDPSNGHVLAMANYPTYNPADYQNVSSAKVFQNGVVDNAIEPGSIMKTLTTSAALNSGAITPNESFYDPAHWVINGFNIHDIKIDGGARQQNIASILALSLNTGATWMLMQMSQKGSTIINQQGIDTWHNYMVNHFQLGKPTGIQQGYEDPGFVPSDNPNQPAIDLKFANTAFGQGVQVTPIQMAAALSSVLNGGTYYKPSVVAEIIKPNGQVVVNKPQVVDRNVVKPSVGPELVPLMEGVVKAYLHGGFSFMNFPSNYIVGGKTGTAQIAMPTGGYYTNIFNGSYIGFVGGVPTKPQYVIVTYDIKPNITGYAGSFGGQPIFADLAHMLINEGYASPEN